MIRTSQFKARDFLYYLKIPNNTCAIVKFCFPKTDSVKQLKFSSSISQYWHKFVSFVHCILFEKYRAVFRQCINYISLCYLSNTMRDIKLTTIAFFELPNLAIIETWAVHIAVLCRTRTWLACVYRLTTSFPQIKLNSSWFCASLEKVFFELNNWSCQESRKFTIRDFVDCLRFHILKTSVKLNCNLLGTTLFSIIKSFTTKKLQRSRFFDHRETYINE